MKLHDWDFAPTCRRVRMFLLEKKLQIPKEECITPSIALKDPFIKYYKHAMVPMLGLDDGTRDRRGPVHLGLPGGTSPEPAAAGTTALEKATILAWERRAFTTKAGLFFQTRV